MRECDGGAYRVQRRNDDGCYDLESCRPEERLCFPFFHGMIAFQITQHNTPIAQAL